MAIEATLEATPENPKPGDTITVTQKVTGNDGTPPGEPKVVTISADPLVGDRVIHVELNMSIPSTPGVDPLPVVYSAPVAAGFTFRATSDPAVWTAVVPA